MSPSPYRSFGSLRGLRLVHAPFPVATYQLRQLPLDDIGSLDIIPSRFGLEPRPMEGALGYLRRPRRDRWT